MKTRHPRRIPPRQTHGRLWTACTPEQRRLIQRLLGQHVDPDDIDDDDRLIYALLIGHPGTT